MNEVTNIIGKLNSPEGLNKADLTDYSIRYNLLQYYKLLDDTHNYISREFSYILYEGEDEEVKIEDSKNQIIWEENLNNYKINNKDKNNFNKIRGHKINKDTQINLFVVGDLEGNITLFYNWLIANKFIDENLNWIHTEETNQLTLIVQCGDQIDTVSEKDEDTNTIYYRSNFRDREIDLAMLLFMDYLNLRSNGKVLSIIGNHEWFNVVQYYDYAERLPITVAESNNLFDKNSVLGRIINRRNFIIRIDKYLFAHGGITNIELNIYNKINNNEKININNLNNYITEFKEQFNTNQFIYDINLEIFNDINWENNNYDNKTNIYKYVINPEGYSGEIGIVFSRYLTYIDETDYSTLFDEIEDKQEVNIQIEEYEKLFPKILNNFTIITGHNSKDNMIICSKENCVFSTRLDNENIKKFLEKETDSEYYTEKNGQKVINIFTDVNTRQLKKSPNNSSISLFVLNIVSNKDNKDKRKFKTESYKCYIKDNILMTTKYSESEEQTNPYKNVCYKMNSLIYLKKYLSDKSKITDGSTV